MGHGGEEWAVSPGQARRWVSEPAHKREKSQHQVGVPARITVSPLLISISEAMRREQTLGRAADGKIGMMRPPSRVGEEVSCTGRRGALLL